MAHALQNSFGEHEDENLDDYPFDFEEASSPYTTDDNGLNIDLNRHIEFMLDSITRIGGEVCKLRAEVDGLLDQNSVLNRTFQRLRDVIDEKGMLDLDDFQLACDVFEEGIVQGGSGMSRKMSHWGVGDLADSLINLHSFLKISSSKSMLMLICFLGCKLEWVLFEKIRYLDMINAYIFIKIS